MCDGIRPLALSNIDKRLCNHGTRKRCAQQILALVDRPRLECRPDILLKKLLRQIDNMHFRRTRGECLVMHGFEFLTLPDIGADSDDLAAIIVLFQPGNDNRGIKTAGIRKDYLFNLLFHV